MKWPLQKTSAFQERQCVRLYWNSAAQGLVSFLPRKGVMIRNFTRKDVEEIFELRRVIELAAVEKVAKTNPPCDLSMHQQTYREIRKKPFDQKRFHWLHESGSGVSRSFL
jgi:DNA-binding GntR family transcriptional regulator